MRRSRSKIFSAALIAGAFLAPTYAASRTAYAEIASWISTSSGFWNQPFRWSSNPTFPSNDHHDVFLNGTANYTVTLNAPNIVRIYSLTMSNPNATLLHTDAARLEVDFVLDLQTGTYSLNNGTLALAYGNNFSGFNNAARLNLLNSQMLYLGQPSGTFVNSGTITATNSSMQVGQLVNTGTISLSNSSLTMQSDQSITDLNNITFANNSRLRVQSDMNLLGQNVAPSYQWEIEGGSVSNGTISLGTASALRVVGNFGGGPDTTFFNVYVNAPIVVEGTLLALDADCQISPGQIITLNTAQLISTNPLDGGIQIVMDGSCSVYAPSVEPGVIVRRGPSNGTAGIAVGVNRGTIMADNGTIRFNSGDNRANITATNGASVITIGQTYNSGTISVGTFGVLSLGGQWRNSGTMSVIGGNVDLTANPITADGTFHVVGSTVNVKSAITSSTVNTVLNGGSNNTVAIVANGTLVNGGLTLTIDSPWLIRDGGRMNGGTLLSSGPLGRVAIPLSTSNGAVFEDVRIGAPIDVANAATLSLINSTVIPGGVISLNGTGTFTYTDLSSSTIAGEVVFNDSLQTGRGIVRGAFNAIAPSGIVRTGTSGGNLQTVGSQPIGVNNGLISAQTPLATLFVGSFTNNGTMQATNGAVLDVTSGLVHAGTLHVESGGTINLRGTTQWLSAGTLSAGVGGGGVNVFGTLNLNNNTITLSSATGPLTLRSGSSTVGPGTFDSTDNTALIVRDGTAAIVNVALRGQVLVQPTATASIAGNWSNTGSIVADSARATLGGNFLTSDFDSVRAIGGTLLLTGAMNNAGQTMQLSFDNGFVGLDNNGLISGGTIAATGGAKLNGTGFGTLSNVVSTGPIVVQPAGTTNVVNGVTLLNLAQTLPGSSIQFRGTQLLQGTGEIALEGGTIGQSGGTLTIAPTIVIRTGSAGGTLAAGSGIVNQGLISAQTPAANLFVNGTLTNQRTVEAINGSTLTVSAALTSFNNAGIVRAGDGGRISFARPANLATTGTFTGGTWIVENFSTISFSAGSILTNAATVSISGANSSFNALAPLVINSGTIAFDAGARFSSAGTLSNSRTMFIGNGSAMHVVNTLNNTGTIDVNGALLAQYPAFLPSPLGAFQLQIVAGRNGGAWDGPGLTSSAARAAFPQNLTLGIMEGADYLAIYGPGATLANFVVTADMVLVRSTFYGDTDFNGLVDFDDYSRIDSGFNNGATGWINGDFDLNGIVDFDDYSLIDLAFNTQSGTLARASSFLRGDDRSQRGMNTPSLELIEQHFAMFGEPFAANFLNAIPEPYLPVVGLGIGGLVLRGCRRRQ